MRLDRFNLTRKKKGKVSLKELQDDSWQEMKRGTSSKALQWRESRLFKAM